MLKPLVVLGFLATNFYVYHEFARDQIIPPRQAFAQFPLHVGAWECPRRGLMDHETLSNLGASDYLICDYHRTDPASFVGVYVGYHESQIREEGGGSGENSIHPPKHCLPGSGWDIIGHSIVQLDVPGLPQPAYVNRMVIAKGDARQMVYYWYQTQGRVIADDWLKIVYLSWDRMRRQRTDGALVRFTAPIYRDGEDAAEREIHELASELVPRLAAYVPN